MKKIALILSLIALIGLSACHSNKNGNVLISRVFPTQSWERFDYIEKNFEFKKPVSYDLVLTVALTPDYPFDYFEIAFTVFDDHNHPLRAKNYKFTVKDREGNWKSEPAEDEYRFTFPINSELTLNEPGKYKFQIENRMPITPLLGIKELLLIDK